MHPIDETMVTNSTLLNEHKLLQVRLQTTKNVTLNLPMQFLVSEN